VKDPTLALNRPTSSQLRVAFLSWRDIKHPEAGGAEIFLEQVSAGLAARGHRVTVVTARYPGSVAMEAAMTGYSSDTADDSVCIPAASHTCCADSVPTM